MLLDIPPDIIEDIVLEEATIPAFPGLNPVSTFFRVNEGSY